MLHLISYELMRHNCLEITVSHLPLYHVCRFIVFVWGPYISDWESETNCFTIIQLYYMLLWRLLNFTNKKHEVIRVWININIIYVMFLVMQKKWFFAPCFFCYFFFFKLICLLREIYYKVYLIMWNACSTIYNLFMSVKCE